MIRALRQFIRNLEWRRLFRPLRFLARLLIKWQDGREAQHARDTAQAARQCLGDARRRGDTRAAGYYRKVLSEAVHADLRCSARGWRGRGH